MGGEQYEAWKRSGENLSPVTFDHQMYPERIFFGDRLSFRWPVAGLLFIVSCVMANFGACLHERA
jgi:hypothetical protein